MDRKWAVMVVSHRSNRTHRPDHLVEFQMKEKLLFRKCDTISALISNGASVHGANNERHLLINRALPVLCPVLLIYTTLHLQAGDTALHIAVRASALTAVHQLMTADTSVVTARNKVLCVFTFT